jgi:methionyl-tRNA formyltransferase
VNPLRIVFVTQEDPFYIAEFFRSFFADSRAGSGIAEFPGAWILDTLGQKDSAGLLRRMYGLYGARNVVRLAARYAGRRLRAELHDRAGTGNAVTVQQILRGQGIDVQRCANINGPAALEAVAAARPDTIFSISATQKFGAAFLALPRLGCFNSHSGDLPRFRGMMPTFWTLYENEPNATVTVHKMAPKIDAGEIWRRERIPIGSDDSLDDVILATKRLSARMMWSLVEALREGSVELQANDESQKRYYKFPTTRDSAILRSRGRRLL